jgi:uncharacterized OB-fold protein
MKSKLIWIAIVVAIGAFVVNSHLEQKAKSEAQKAETSRVQQEVKAAVSHITERQNAITDWEKQLSKGERYRLSPILTIELENLWQSERPVLFIGSIKDISSADATAYYVLVEQSLYNMDYMFATELRLSLQAPKAVIDSFLQKHPKFLAADGFNNGVAVVAKIHNISTSDERDENGERVEVKTGQGHLLELVYTGDVFF